MNYRAVLTKAGFYLPKTISASLNRLYYLYLEWDDTEYLDRFCDILENAKQRYPDFARSVEGIKHIPVSETINRVLPAPY